MKDVVGDYFDNLMKSFLSTLSTPDAYLNKVALTAVILLISLLLRMLFRRLVKKNVSDFKKRFSLQTAIKTTMITLTVISILFVWIQAINALILVALLLGAFLVIMVRGLTNNIIGFFVIKYRKYFKVDHRIEINDLIGDVIEINLVSFQLLEVRNWLSSDSNTGRVIKLPNQIIFDEPIEMIGLTNIFVLHEIKYVLTFDSNWQEAEKIMTDIGDTYFHETLLPEWKEVNERMPKDQEALMPVFSLNTNDDGIVLILRYLVDYRKGTRVKTLLQRQILSQFDQNPQIKFAVLDIRILTE